MLEVKSELCVIVYAMEQISHTSNPPDCATFHVEIACAGPNEEETFRLDSVSLNARDILAKADNQQRTWHHSVINVHAQFLSRFCCAYRYGIR